MEKRVFLIVLDSFGIGAEPDAAAFGDEGTNTLGAIAKHPNFNCPNLKKLGLFNIDGVTVGEKDAAPIGSFARLQEQSMGKDTTIGHWEIAGVVSPKPLPTFPDGFPDSLIHEFEEKTGHKVLCNKPYSGTQVLKGESPEQLVITEGCYLVDNVLWTQGGYLPMQEGESYLLFLTAYDRDSVYAGMYFPTELEKGKYPLTDKPLTASDSADAWEVYVIEGDDLHDYQDWYQQITALYPELF